MPSLDVSEILDDPDFQTEIVIMQIVKTTSEETGVDSYERVPVATVPAVVIQEGGMNMRRDPDGTVISGGITVYCRYELQVGEGDRVADILFWKRKPYTVVGVMDWSEFGAGYYRAECIPKRISG